MKDDLSIRKISKEEQNNDVSSNKIEMSLCCDKIS